MPRTTKTPTQPESATKPVASVVDYLERAGWHYSARELAEQLGVAEEEVVSQIRRDPGRIQRVAVGVHHEVRWASVKWVQAERDRAMRMDCYHKTERELLEDIRLLDGLLTVGYSRPGMYEFRPVCARKDHVDAFGIPILKDDVYYKFGEFGGFPFAVSAGAMDVLTAILFNNHGFRAIAARLAQEKDAALQKSLRDVANALSQGVQPR